MKKKIISFLLVVCMLIMPICPAGAVPVAECPFTLTATVSGDQVSITISTNRQITFDVFSLGLNNPAGMTAISYTNGKDYNSFNFQQCIKNLDQGKITYASKVTATGDTTVAAGKVLAVYTADISALSYGNHTFELVVRSATDFDDDLLSWTGSKTSVTFKKVAVKGITVDEDICITPSEDKELTVNVLPASATNKKVAFKSSNEKVATVDENGKVHAVKAGKAVVTATTEDGGYSAKCNVVVEFTDVRKDPETGKGKYYYSHVYWAVDKGITNGFEDTDGYRRTFGPEEYCTREQMVTFLYRLMGKPKHKIKTSPFSDVKKGDYYYDAVLWAYEKGITKGYSSGEKAGTFGVGEPCQREHAVTFLWRAAGKPAPKTTKNTFTDVNKKDYYYKACLWASENEIAKGYVNKKTKVTTFDPKGTCLREHTVTFIGRYNEKFMNS